MARKNKKNGTADKPNKKAKQDGWITWRSAECRATILSDLINRILPDEVRAEEAWVVYQDMEEFSGVVFFQFKERLKDHRKQIGKKIIAADDDAKAVMRSRFILPRSDKDSSGKLVFDMHPAKNLLRCDIEANFHVGKTPSQIQKTRKEYGFWDKIHIFQSNLTNTIKIFSFDFTIIKYGSIIYCSFKWSLDTYYFTFVYVNSYLILQSSSMAFVGVSSCIFCCRWVFIFPCFKINTINTNNDNL